MGESRRWKRRAQRRRQAQAAVPARPGPGSVPVPGGGWLSPASALLLVVTTSSGSAIHQVQVPDHLDAETALRQWLGGQGCTERCRVEVGADPSNVMHVSATGERCQLDVRHEAACPAAVADASVHN